MVVFLLLTLTVPGLLGQGKMYTGPEDPPGDISAIRSGHMNGNRMLLYFENNTQIADYPPVPGNNLWPNDYNGLRMIDVASVLVGSQIILYQDSIPIDRPDDPRLSEAGLLDTLYFVQSHSYASNNPDMNYDNTVEWGLYPVPGYCNPAQDYAAMSNKPGSWPPEGWPLTGRVKVWPGEWNGRFGRGVMSAALESYFVANDAQDMEYIIQRNDPEERLITEGPRYLPRPGRTIGDVDPGITIQNGLPWGGLGLRMEVRGYQWSNFEAQDIVFWEYNITNISDYDLPTCGFGYYIDNCIGGDFGAENEVGYRDKVLDLSYVWERQGIGEAGKIPGVMGYAYLESPGKPYDGVDDDDDGLMDEKRDNEAGSIVGPTEGIDNLPKFLNFYHFHESELKPHFEGDEDQDWRDGVDPDNDGMYAELNEQGVWVLEPGAFAGDDVGIDGVGPGDLNYYGPDPDGTECNHKPDFLETKGEPNFGPLDVSESDMLGLTSFLMFDWNEWQTIFRLTLNEDENVWNQMNSDSLSEFLVAGSYGSLYMIFASSPFPFYKGRTERVSMAFMAAYENLAAINASGHRAQNLFRLKDVAQVIYEHDYQFAQPPLMPTLKAIPGDGKVILTWDDFSDQMTQEPLLGKINDFEGYKLYKSTDKYMSDPQIITDGKGAKKFRAPIFQCDKVDTITGYCAFGGSLDGRLAYLGDDTGLRHSFVDTDVQNGRTYYYALVAYDYGIEDLNVAPAENMVEIELDESENVIRMGQNVQVVTPGQTAAGYVPAGVTLDMQRSSERLTRGAVTPTVVAWDELKPGHTYKMTFSCDATAYLAAAKQRRSFRDGRRVTAGIEVFDVTGQPALVYREDSTNASAVNNLKHDEDLGAWLYPPGEEITTDIFDGLQCSVRIPVDTVGVDLLNTGWIQGQAPIRVQVSSDAEYFPYQYDIVFDPAREYQSVTEKAGVIFDVDGSRIDRTNRTLGLTYPFHVVNTLYTDSLGNPEKVDMILFDANQNKVFDWDTDRILVGYPVLDKSDYWWGGTIFSFDFIQAGSATDPTSQGDRYRLSLTRPFSESDSVFFTVVGGQAVDPARLKNAMDSIKVVPNPYIATNLMETAVANQYLNQRRQILFTHIPANCVIQVFTPSGVLVDKIAVENEPTDGTVHWDVLSREGLEIAAGMYIYHVKSTVTGDEKVGKFAVIK
ncbi:hypothetical protein JW906_14810 [bacterium]|nr:hypothetical protein [bacterium]